MSEDKSPRSNNDKEYLEFVAERLKNTDFHAKEKLQKIDELADIIYLARSNYQKSKKA